MNTLDLHGIIHEEVSLLVEDFILLNETPLRIITGNSPRMQFLVNRVLEKHDLHWDYESYLNLGAIIVIS